MTVAVLVMAYGTPQDRDAVLGFYTDVRRGRPPTGEQLADLASRYDAIGGLFPMNERTSAQILALQRALDEIEPGKFQTYYGAKHASPRIEEAIERAAAEGCSGVVGLVLAPHYSAMSVGEYIERARKRATGLGLRSAFIEHWHEEPALVEALAARVERSISALPASKREGVTIVFTAHSLPRRILTTGDAYPEAIKRTAALVAERLHLDKWITGWQSAGRTTEPWLGPDISETIEDLAQKGVPSVIVCACGFTSDHLEVLYDLDILASSVAERAGIAFGRTESINAEPAVFDALAARLAALSRDVAS